MKVEKCKRNRLMQNGILVKKRVGEKWNGREKNIFKCKRVAKFEKFNT